MKKITWYWWIFFAVFCIVVGYVTSFFPYASVTSTFLGIVLGCWVRRHFEIDVDTPQFLRF